VCYVPRYCFRMEFVDQKGYAEINQDQRYLNTVIMKYNDILLKISKYKQLDLARIKQLHTFSQILHTEMPSCNENEIRNVIDNLHLFALEKTLLQNTVESDFDPTVCLRNLLRHLSNSSSSKDYNVLKNESKAPVDLISNYDDFLVLDKEVASCTETFQELEKRIGTILHTIQISPSQTYETTISHIMQDVSTELEALGLNISNLNTDFQDPRTLLASSSIPTGPTLIDDPSDKASEVLLQLYNILWPPSDSDGSSDDVVSELLQRLRQRHLNALTKSASLCESYCPFHIHLKNRINS